MKLSLVVQTPGRNQAKVLEINLPQFVIGRDPQCHLRPNSSRISKRHCAVLQRDNKVFVRDFESINGTFVNDEQVKCEVELHDGDRLRMGPLLFEVKIEVAAPVSRPVVARKPADAPAVQAEAQTETSAEGGSTSNDEDIAAMLLSLPDDSCDGPFDGGLEVPEGSTVHEMPLPTDLAARQAQGREKARHTAPRNTSQAAKSILAKYMNRPAAQ